MARNPRNRRARRTLAVLATLLVLLFGSIGAAHVFANPKAPLSPLLGLDLAGGRQLVIEPVVEGGGAVEPEQVEQAIDIIRRRIDGSGVSESEVSRLGDTNIVVSIPGSPSAEQLEALSRSSQLRFRTVLASAPAVPLPTSPATPTRELPLPGPPVVDVPTPSAPATSDPATTDPDTTDPDTTDPDATDAATTDPATTDPPSGTSSAPATTNAAYPEGLLAAGATTSAPGTTPPPSPPPADGDEATETAPATEDPTSATPTDASDLAWITPELQQQFAELNCADQGSALAATADPDEPTVACSVDGTEKYILGPSELSGAEVVDASSGPELGQGGQPTGRVEVRLNFNDEGREAFREVTTRLFSYPPNTDQNRFAIVLDGEVISAPTVNGVIPGGSAQITGGFTNESAEILANQLKFGALPTSFAVQTSEQVSPTLGGEQLRAGLIAGAVGLLLVFVYSLLQYRALGLVTVGSLVVAALMAYGLVTFLGWATNFRLTMAGVTGLIVAIGITADSFIVYFERIRDEVRAGRPLRYAVDTGWMRARRTILVSDLVNLMAATVLYWLSESGVKAFAFALGLTTVIDLIVVFLFTHPVVSILANTRFFGEGHKWSGMDPERLGAKRSTYLGRGQFALPEGSPVGAHHRPTREQLEGGIV